MTVAVLEKVEAEPLAEAPTIECFECSERFPEGDLSEVKSGEMVCDDCISDRYTTCHECSDITPDGEVQTVNRGYETVCDNCLEAKYVCCQDCEEYVRDYDIYSAYNGDRSICGHCSDHYYHYCDYCDTRVQDDDDDHYHDGDTSTDCCESPALHFTMPCGTVQDSIIEVTLPDGVIGMDGFYEANNLAYYDYMYDWEARDRIRQAIYGVGNEYVNKDGKYAKRVAKYLHKNYGMKLSESLLAKIGQAAQKASVGGTRRIAFTRQLNLSAYDFYHEDSCWWSDYAYSRCTLKSNGGLGMRSFDEDGEVSGRAWVFPLRRDEAGNLRPTFDTANADAFVVFNGYGDLDEDKQARALAATVEGWVSRKVDFSPGNMYVNAGGFLVGPPDMLEGVNGLPYWGLAQHTDLYRNETMKDAA